MGKLNRSKLVRDVNLLISDELVVAEVKMRKFQVDMSVDPGAESAAGRDPVENHRDHGRIEISSVPCAATLHRGRQRAAMRNGGGR